MKKYVLVLITTVLIGPLGFAQSDKMTEALEKNKAFSGAQAEEMNYKAIFQLDSSDPKIIAKTIRNINNVLADPRLEGKLEIEVITFSGGTQALLKKNEQYREPFQQLIEKGVIVAQCENSLKEQNRTKDEFFEFVSFVPSGNGELIIRAKQGWVIVKP